MLAGHLGSRRTRLGETEVTVASPLGQGMRRMDVLTLLTFVWPQVQALYPATSGQTADRRGQRPDVAWHPGRRTSRST